MAAAQSDEIEGEMSHPGYYDNARGYVLDHLDPHEPRSPSELAEEYECGGDHMRKTLAELAESGEVERVSRGQYTLPGVEASTKSGDHMGTDVSSTTTSGTDTGSTAELYQQQYAQYGDDEDREITHDDAGTGGSGDLDDGNAGGVESSTPSAALPMDPRSLGLILGVALILWLSFRTLGGPAESGPDAGGEQAGGDADLVPGGLTG